MSLLQIFKKKQVRPERLPRVLRAMELFITDQQYTKIPRDQTLDSDYDHMKESIRYAKLLAGKRKIDRDMACIACAMQNVGRIQYGETDGHAESGYAVVKRMLSEMGCFGQAEIEQLATAVRRHNNKDKVDTPLDELVKDVDIYVQYLSGKTLTRVEDVRRLSQLKLDLHI